MHKIVQQKLNKKIERPEIMVEFHPNQSKLFCSLSCLKAVLLVVAVCVCIGPKCAFSAPLRFNKNGQFKILQVADMHYANGKSTSCLNVLPYQVKDCSDLNTTAFIQRMITAEKPDLIVFTATEIVESFVVVQGSYFC